MLFGRRKNRQDKEWSDLELVEKYRQEDDMEALGKLYQRYTGLVYGVSLKYFKDQEKSKDAVMQIFEELVDKLKKHEVSNFKSWLHVVTRNHCLMAIRSSKNNHHDDINEINPDKHMEFAQFLHHDGKDEKEMQLQQLSSAIDNLNDEQKICIKLFYLENRCYQEIVEQTGFELKKVKSYIQNGRRNLKILMEKS